MQLAYSFIRRSGLDRPRQWPRAFDFAFAVVMSFVLAVGQTCMVAALVHLDDTFSDPTTKVGTATGMWLGGTLVCFKLDRCAGPLQAWQSQGKEAAFNDDNAVSEDEMSNDDTDDGDDSSLSASLSGSTSDYSSNV